MTFRRTSAVLIAASVLSLPIAVSPLTAPPAYALFGFGDIVYDPSNHAENIIQAARALEQIGPKHLAPPERLQSSATGGAPEPVLGARCEKPPGRSIRSAPSGGPSSGPA